MSASLRRTAGAAMRLARSAAQAAESQAAPSSLRALTTLNGIITSASPQPHGGVLATRPASSPASPFGRRTFASDSSSEEEDLVESYGVIYPPTEARVGMRAPEFNTGAVVDGEIKKIKLSDYKGKYVVLFFYPKDFTFVCPTEIIAFSDRAKEFESLNCQLIAASTDTEECHLAWIRTPRTRGGLGYMQIPIIADTTKEISARYGVLIEKLGIALRGLFIINPEGVIQQITVNDLPSESWRLDE